MIHKIQEKKIEANLGGLIMTENTIEKELKELERKNKSMEEKISKLTSNL